MKIGCAIGISNIQKEPNETAKMVFRMLNYAIETTKVISNIVNREIGIAKVHF
jgi:hypothetical protein